MSRARITLGALGLALLAAPLVVSDYTISVLVLVLFAAYFGQAWNIMMGFAGQLSLGHALYLGLGAYVSAALFVGLGLSPWLGMIAGALAATLAGAVIGALGFRFGVAGVYFALLTIAFNEFTRVVFDHLAIVGGSAGLFLPVANRAGVDLASLRGGPVLFYYVLLAGTVGVLVLCRALLARRIGYHWLAIREDQEAAAALGINVFRAKLAAVALSAGLTSIGGTLHAFYYNNLYPETIFSTARSVELILGPIIGGLGTLFGPIVGAVVLTALSEGFTAATEGMRLDGAKQFLYGLTLAIIVVARPTGIWPWLSARLGFDRKATT